VISRHSSCVRSCAFDLSNSWFCTSFIDRITKICHVASGKLKLTLTGHTDQVWALAVSRQHPYMFSIGDDKQVKCRGHLSGVHCLALHLTTAILFAGGRLCVPSLWHSHLVDGLGSLFAHSDTVCSVFARAVDPQIVTGLSQYTTIKLYNLAAWKQRRLSRTTRSNFALWRCIPQSKLLHRHQLKTWRTFIFWKVSFTQYVVSAEDDHKFDGGEQRWCARDGWWQREHCNFGIGIGGSNFQWAQTVLQLATPE